MQECQNQLAKGLEDLIYRDDIFAQVMGKDKRGHVRMLGLGVRPSDIWGAGFNQNTRDRMIMEQQTTLSRMEAHIQRLESRIIQQDSTTHD